MIIDYLFMCKNWYIYNIVFILRNIFLKSLHNYAIIIFIFFEFCVVVVCLQKCVGYKWHIYSYYKVLGVLRGSVFQGLLYRLISDISAILFFKFNYNKTTTLNYRF